MRIILPMVIAVLGLLLSLLSTQEIEPSEYEEIAAWVENHPSLAPLVDEAMADDEIGSPEYRDIEDACYELLESEARERLVGVLNNSMEEE